ncbi:hypothetical protein [Nocardia vaccinii]|uniref:hypothetical protein n=1 Tax=Nocardia vaccinii TaxID=1822 RepID=UPI000832E70A|nr:hypothetical protein [Nocardia vaccinii]
MTDRESRRALATAQHRVREVRRAWTETLGPGERSAVWAWAAFTTTFGVTRVLTHWIRAGHGPTGGGFRLGGRHFHHYNIGIAMLAAVGLVALRGTERARRHPVVATSYGAASALIIDELALLLDLEDVYWAREGRTSVDAAIVVIGTGGVATAGFEFWPRAHHALWGR